MPNNPVAWLVSAGRFKAIDRIRRDRRFVSSQDASEQVEAVADDAPGWEQRWDEREAVEDDLLRTVFGSDRAEPENVTATVEPEPETESVDAKTVEPSDEDAVVAGGYCGAD